MFRKRLKNKCEGVNKWIMFGTSTSVDIPENVSSCGTVIEIFSGVFYKKNFTDQPFQKICENISF